MMKNCHRMFLQSLMSKGILNAEDVFKLLKSCCEKYDELQADFHEDKRNLLVDFVHLINDNLKVFGMEIRKGVDEMDGSSYYGLVNITESSITLLASVYTDNELQFYKKLVELIMLSDEGSIGSIAAVNIADSMQKKMLKAEAEDLLDRFEREYWIGKTKEGRVYLAARSIMEMEQYIFDMFGENAVRCCLCKKLCVQGNCCDNCSSKLHYSCFNKLFKENTEKKCPSCKNLWSNDTDTDAETQKTSSRSAQSRKRKATTEVQTLYSRVT